MSQISKENAYGQNTLMQIKDNAEKQLCLHIAPVWYCGALSFNHTDTKLVSTLVPGIRGQYLAVTC